MVEQNKSLAFDGTPIKAVIWDVGGVLVRTVDMGPRSHLAQRFGMTAQELEALVYHNETALRVETGEAVEEDNWRNIFKQLGLSMAELDDFRHQFWGGDELNIPLMTFIDQIRTHYRVGIISNAWPGMRDMLEKQYDLLKHFDRYIFSAHVGVRKPHPRIFEMALKALEAEPQEAVFIDDMKINVEGAQKAGLKGVWFKSTDQTIADLQAMLRGGL